jgi:hypothetical protein
MVIMRGGSGKLSFYFKLSNNKKIIVENSHYVPIYGLGSW